MSKAAEVAKDYTISNLYLRGYLAGLRKITGSQYPRLLEQVGLGQFSYHYPLNDLRPAAKGLQFMRLNALVGEVLDPNFQELFLKNLGREFARTVATAPYIQKELDKIDSLNEPENIRKAIEICSRFNSMNIEQEICFASEDDPIAKEALEQSPSGGVVIIFKNCLYCAHLEHSPKPACSGVSSYFKEIIPMMASSRGVRGLRFQCDEILCAAKDEHTDCYFLIRRARHSGNLN